MPYPRRPTPIKPKPLHHSTGLTCTWYYVSDFASVKVHRRSLSSKAGGVRITRLDPWRDVSQVDVHSVRRGEHADRFCSSSLKTPCHRSVNKAVHNQITAMYCLFNELISLDVVLTQITDPWIHGSSHIYLQANYAKVFLRYHQFLHDNIVLFTLQGTMIIVYLYIPKFLEISYHVFLYKSSSSLSVLKQRINAQIAFLSRCSSRCVYLEFNSVQLLISPARTKHS